jgi:hypothetical protein
MSGISWSLTDLSKIDLGGRRRSYILTVFRC